MLLPVLHTPILDWHSANFHCTEVSHLNDVQWPFIDNAVALILGIIISISRNAFTPGPLKRNWLTLF